MNVGKYLRGEDRHVGTARVVSKAARARAELVAAHPLMKSGNTLEFKQRLQWLSEGMLRNHMTGVINYVVDQDEIDLYHKYKENL